MAYVRKRGSQLAVVQGRRNKVSGKVEQEILFTIYSKAEARHVLGRSGREQEAEKFKGLMRRRHPDVKFDWKKLLRGIEENSEALPDLYEYKEKRLLSGFREDLESFARRLVKADPAGSSGAPLFEFRHELLFLRTMIDERLTALATSRPEEGSTFFWNEALAAPAIPAEIEEPAIEFYEEGDLGTAEGAFRLLTACYPHYASGHCYLGKIAYDLGRVDEAMKMLELARMTAKGNLKKRGQVVPTSPIWDDDALGLVQATEELARIHCARQEYQVALELADELQFKTLDPATAGQIRAEVYLNQGNWSEAADSAITYSSTKDSCSVLAALAIYEMGEALDAATLYIVGLMNRPEVALAMVAQRLPRSSLQLAPGWVANASRLVARLAPFTERWPSRSQAFFSNLLVFVIREDSLEQLAAAVQASRRGRGLEVHQAEEDVKWLRSSAFADRLARAFLYQDETDAKGVDALELHRPPELTLPGRCNVETVPLLLRGTTTSLESVDSATLLPELMNVHATLLPISLVNYWLQWVGASEVFVSEEAFRTSPSKIPALVFKGGARAARQCNFLLRGIDAVELTAGEEGGVSIVARSGGTLRGTIAVARADEENQEQLDVVAAAAAEWGGRVMLVYSAGGTRRQRTVVRVWDLAGMREVALGDRRGGGPEAPGPVSEGAALSHGAWRLYGTFEVELDGVEPRIWRRFRLRMNGTVMDLHNAIQAACGWEDRHLFEFGKGRKLGQEPVAGTPLEWDEETTSPEAQRVSLSEVFGARQPSTLWYTYDFGDSWKHRVTLIETVELRDGFQRRLVAGEKAFPPEDCGGVYGFHECVAIATGAHTSAEFGEDIDLSDRRTWLGDWHPDKFDLEQSRIEFDQ